jgi:Protein of unknown function (DUF2950)
MSKGTNMRSIYPALGLIVAIGLVLGCAKKEPSPGQRTFSSPEDAVVALVDALKANNTAQLTNILGPDSGNILSSGDNVADKQAREVFLAAYAEKAQLSTEGDHTILSIGAEEWPVPIPLVQDGSNWRFDTAAGMQEVLFRRIGNNELTTMQLCRTYVEAQKEYAAKGHDGKARGIYARKFASSVGKQDGLYWKSDDPNDNSPLGDLAAQAATDGYSKSQGQPTPFYGYYFRILTRRGSSAPGGALEYVINGEMQKGFALIAYPAEYKNSGVMTFIVDDKGTIYQKDLGAETAKVAADINVFDPDSSWEKAEFD